MYKANSCQMAKEIRYTSEFYETEPRYLDKGRQNCLKVEKGKLMAIIFYKLDCIFSSLDTTGVNQNSTNHKIEVFLIRKG